MLRLNPGAVVVPLEPPHLQVTFISPRLQVAELIPVGLRSRPELASRQALVQEALERVRQEQVRPFVPSVVMGGVGPGGAFSGDVFGGGPDNGNHLYGGRFDMEVGVIWTLNNLGAGNRSLIHARIAQEQQASIDFANVQDQVAEEVVQAHAQLDATALQVGETASAVKEAITTYDGTLIGLSQTRGAGDLLQLVSRPQEAVAALQQLNRAYDLFYTAVNGYNRAQFQLYWALGFPARAVICDCPVGEVQAVDTARPPGMARRSARTCFRVPARSWPRGPPSFAAQQPLHFHPILEPVGPGASAGDVRREPLPMLAGPVDVHLGRHARTAQGQVELHAVLRGHALVFIGVKEERRRRLARNLLLIRKAPRQGGIGVAPSRLICEPRWVYGSSKAMTA